MTRRALSAAAPTLGCSASCGDRFRWGRRTAPAATPHASDLTSAHSTGTRAAALPVYRTVLRNGLTLLVRRDRSAPAVAIVTYVKAGYFDESDDVVGIAHVLEHMFFKGTPTRGVGEIARETKASGGYLNAHTIYDHTSYYTVVPASRFDDALAIQADAYANSLIDAAELAKEIEVIIQEVRRKEDAPGAMASEALYALLYDRHRIRRWRMGRPDLLRTFTRDGVRGFYRNFYRPGNTIVSVVGDVDPEMVRRAVEARYGALVDAPVRRTPGPGEGSAAPGPRYREWGGDLAQTQIVLGWRTVPPLHADSPLLDLAALVLGAGRGSRLYRAVRERQLATNVTAYDYSPTELGLFVVHAECPPESAGDAARAVWAQIADVRDGGIAERELQRAQRLLESRWVRRTESMEGQASYLAEWEALGDWMLGEHYLEGVLAATPRAVADAVRRYLDLANVSAVVYRPATVPAVATDAHDLLAPPAAAPPPPLDDTPLDDTPLASGDGARPTRDVTRSARPEREIAGVRVYRTTAGIPVLIRRKPGAQVTHAGVFSFGGARDEGAARGGLTTLMARCALKGAAGRTAAQLAEAIEMLGGSIGASAGSESVGWSISVPARYTADALAVLSDVVQRPTLSEAALDTERALALSELATLRDDMYRYPIRLATQSAFGDHPYGVGMLGSDASLRAITGADARDWHADHVLHGPSVIVVVGDQDGDEMAGEIIRTFDALRPAPPAAIAAPTWPSGAAPRVERRAKAQTALALAFPGPARGDDDRMVAELIAMVASGLGGRFFDELRDRQSLAYTVRAFAAEWTMAGMFVGYIATSPEKEAAARTGLLHEFDKLCEDGVSGDELARAQTYAVGTHAISRQSGASLLAEVIDAWIFGQGLGELESYESRVRAVTRDAVRRVARSYFDPARVVEGIVRGSSK
jgi:zinc protease